MVTISARTIKQYRSHNDMAQVLSIKIHFNINKVSFPLPSHYEFIINQKQLAKRSPA
jgi:hypothetical protein